MKGKDTIMKGDAMIASRNEAREEQLPLQIPQKQFEWNGDNLLAASSGRPKRVKMTS